MAEGMRNRVGEKERERERERAAHIKCSDCGAHCEATGKRMKAMGALSDVRGSEAADVSERERERENRANKCTDAQMHRHRHQGDTISQPEPNKTTTTTTTTINICHLLRQKDRKSTTTAAKLQPIIIFHHFTICASHSH